MVELRAYPGALRGPLVVTLRSPDLSKNGGKLDNQPAIQSSQFSESTRWPGTRLPALDLFDFGRLAKGAKYRPRANIPFSIYGITQIPGD
jgi:hypothetical protein